MKKEDSTRDRRRRLKSQKRSEEHAPSNINYAIKSVLLWFTIGLIAFGVAASAWQMMSEPLIDLPQKGEQAEFYSDHTEDHLGHIVKTALKKAQKSIYIEIFSLSDPKTLKLLNEKSKQGVHIELITDKQYVAQTKRKLRSSISVTPGSTNGLMHRKIVIIDDQMVWLGSVNFTWESLSMHHNLLMGVHSPVLASVLTDPSAPEEGRIMVAGQNMDVWNLPKARTALEHLLNSIQNARTSIHIAMFTWTRTDIVEALVKAQHRGVNVKVVLDKRSSEGASSKVLQLLRAYKIPVRLSQGAQLMHHKFMLIDGKELYFGSVNWTAGGFMKNKDIMIRVPLLSLRQEEFMHKLWSALWIDGVRQ